jgi:hypothetical protein
VVVYGTAEGIEADPERAKLSADVLAVVRGPDRPHPSTIVAGSTNNSVGSCASPPRRC